MGPIDKDTSTAIMVMTTSNSTRVNAAARERLWTKRDLNFTESRAVIVPFIALVIPLECQHLMCAHFRNDDFKHAIGDFKWEVFLCEWQDHPQNLLSGSNCNRNVAQLRQIVDDQAAAAFERGRIEEVNDMSVVAGLRKQ